jgi:hypothetical protein
MKQRNPRWGCPRIAQQIALAFGIDINKDVVRRILSAYYHPATDHAGPSWLSFLGHMKDSLHSIDLFRCESVALRTYWVLVVMDQYTRRIIGFGIQAGIVDGIALCRMFNRAIRGQMVPKYLSSDHDPLYRFHQWQANLRVLGMTEIKTVPYAPLSHPFVERLIERFDANTWTRRCSRPRQIWKRSCCSSRTITMNIALMLASAGRHLTIVVSPFVRICNFIGGENTVTRYFRHPWRRELEFATDRFPL